MIQVQPLDAALSQQVLDYLGVDVETPSPAYLEVLMAAYIRRVPWESASRIARRAQTHRTEDCPRWPSNFWQQAIEHGTGGTCYESNYAFFTLLRWLGFEGYLTINNMGAKIGCHSACVVTFDEDRWLADVGIPLHVPVPLMRDTVTRREGPFHTYTLTPLGEDRYEVSRDRHPSSYIFTLIDTPVAEAAYRTVTTADYGEGGLFLNRVIITRIVDERQWRFSSEAPPYQLETFWQGDVTYHYIGDEPDAVAAAVADKFRLEKPIIREALLVTSPDT